MNACMLQYANQAEQDAAREEWFATRDLRRKEREAKEEKRIEQEKFHREWWQPCREEEQQVVHRKWRRDDLSSRYLVCEDMFASKRA
jgi:hypothetical protein